jgi:hypothetical protein
MKKCREFIAAVVNSLDATSSAKRLNIGLKGFEALFNEGLVHKIQSNSHKRSRFNAAELGRVLERLERSVHKVSNHDDSSASEFVIISDACFLYQMTTGQLVRLLFAGMLPSTRQLTGIPGFIGVRLNRAEIMSAKKVFTDELIAPTALSEHLGLNRRELKTLRKLHFFPHFPAPAGHEYRSRESVGKTVLARFLKNYQTVSTAARHLEIEETVLLSKIDDAGILPAKEGAGVPIYHRSDLLD